MQKSGFLMTRLILQLVCLLVLCWLSFDFYEASAHNLSHKYLSDKSYKILVNFFSSFYQTVQMHNPYMSHIALNLFSIYANNIAFVAGFRDSLILCQPVPSTDNLGKQFEPRTLRQA